MNDPDGCIQLRDLAYWWFRNSKEVSFVSSDMTIDFIVMISQRKRKQLHQKLINLPLCYKVQMCENLFSNYSDVKMISKLCFEMSEIEFLN